MANSTKVVQLLDGTYAAASVLSPAEKRFYGVKNKRKVKSVAKSPIDKLIAKFY